ncbi:ABC transporter substrate-binding protein [Pseudomonas sp. CFBP 8771]|uniref:ABC transporter substrate-binding protein n=1 Tax=unclassified Pseudomonas TaxID=196821 RepID=UPI00177F546C|nr:MULTISPECIES: ABC transporter substrate-binding protein [unclassified Pseudomonas]MBD8601791.1 ABC transporter substrate-binding protein [Pseudomonas sp. CFBP 8771]MBD8825031.1 ABC transporter substrate-binding protein [Pseudomonas sp. CFBP 13602]
MNLPAVFVRASVAAVGLFAAVASHAATHYPLTLPNCGAPLTVQAAPQRAVSLGQASTEILLSLGLAPRMVGTGVWFGPLPEPLRAANAQVPRLADNAPSFEAVATTAPDIVVAQYTYHVGPNGEVAKPEQLASLGIPSYVSPSDCDGKEVTATSNADGSRSQVFSMALVDKEIRELASIFDVEAAGERLTDQLHARIQKATERAGSAGHAPLSVVYWFSSTRLEGDPWVAGKSGAPGYINRLLGLRNIVDSDEEWPGVSWESIAASNPDVIVVARMQRRLYPADDVEKKLAFLRSDPVTRELDAVRNGRIIVVDAQSLNPSMDVVRAVEDIAAGLERTRATP